MSRRLNESPVWTDFEKINNDAEHVKCKLCGNILSFKGGSTGTMLHHLKYIHKKENTATSSDTPSKCQKTLSTFGITTGRHCNTSRKIVINDLIADIVIECNLPYSFVEQDAFRKLLDYVEPNYKPTTSENVKCIIAGKANLLKEKLRNEINSCLAVSLTTDAWSSNTNNSFLSVTASSIRSNWEMFTPVLDVVYLEDRHTTEYLSSVIQLVIEDWKIESKIMCITHDNAANVAHIGEHINSHYEDIGCAAHNFHLAVLDAMGMKTQVTNHPIGRTVNACSKLVGHFSHSVLASEELKKRCQSMQPDSKQYKLIQYTRIRWNSICDMFQRIDNLKWPVIAVLGDVKVTKKSDAEHLELKVDQWKLISDLHPILNAIKIASTMLCAENNPSISIVLPVVYGLIRNKLQLLEDDSNVITKFKRDFTNNLELRFGLKSPNLAMSVVALACVLDPRYKKLQFLSSENKDLAYSKVREFLDNEKDDSEVIQKKPRLETENNILDFDDSDDEFQEKTEYARYLDEPPVLKSACPLAWWSSNEKRFPSVAKLAKKYLCVPATSTASERLFSAAGNIITKKRCRLLPETSRKVIFVRQNNGLL